MRSLPETFALQSPLRSPLSGGTQSQPAPVVARVRTSTKHSQRSVRTRPLPVEQAWLPI